MLRVLRPGILLHNLCVLQSHLKESGLVYRSKDTEIDLTVLAARDSDGATLLHHAAEYGQSLEFYSTTSSLNVISVRNPLNKFNNISNRIPLCLLKRLLIINTKVC